MIASLKMGIVALGLATASAVSAAPPVAHRGAHHYIYYPAQRLYFAPETQMWFWPEGDGWSSGAALPVAPVVAAPLAALPVPEGDVERPDATGAADAGGEPAVGVADARGAGVAVATAVAVDVAPVLVPRTRNEMPVDQSERTSFTSRSRPRSV